MTVINVISVKRQIIENIGCFFYFFSLKIYFRNTVEKLDFMLRISAAARRRQAVRPTYPCTAEPKSSSEEQEADAKDLPEPSEVDKTYRLLHHEELTDALLGDDFQPEITNERGIVFEVASRRGKLTTDDVSSFQFDLVCQLCHTQFETDEDLYDHIDVPHTFVCDCGDRFIKRSFLGLHMKEKHADILQLDNCPKCNFVWTKSFKRTRRARAVVKDACFIGEHWGSAHLGKCPTCKKINFVDGRAVYEHRKGVHSEEKFLGICASRKCMDPIIGTLKTPTGMGYCGKHKPKSKDIKEHVFFSKNSRKWEQFNVDIEQGMAICDRYCTDFPREFFSQQNIRLSFKQKEVLRRHLERFGVRPQEFKQLKRKEIQDLLISHFNPGWKSDPVRIEYNPVTVLALKSCWRNKWTTDKDGHHINRAANLSRWKHFKENWESRPTLIPDLVNKRRGLFTSARAAVPPKEKIVKELTVAFPEEGGSLAIKGLSGAQLCSWMECRQKGRRAWISMVDGASIVFEEPSGKIFVPERLPPVSKEEKVDLLLRGAHGISCPRIPSTGCASDHWLSAYACTLSCTNGGRERCGVYGTKSDIFEHYMEFHKVEKNKVHELIKQIKVKVPSFDKPMIEALRTGRGHDEYPPLFLFKNCKYAGIPRHVFEAVRKADFVLEKYFKKNVAAFKQHLSAASGDKSCSQYSKIYCSQRNRAVRALRRAQEKFTENKGTSVESLRKIDEGLYLKDGQIRHVFEDSYHKANLGIPRLDLIKLK